MERAWRCWELVVHPPSLRCFGQHRDASLSTRPMPTTPASAKGMPMGVPIRRRCLHGLAHLVPCFETTPFEGQRPQHFPPRFDQVERGRIRGLEDKFPARVGQGKHQDIGGTMHVEIIQHAQFIAATRSRKVDCLARCGHCQLNAKNGTSVQ